MTDLQTALREPSDIDWVEEEAWRRASQWTATPELVFALKALIKAAAEERGQRQAYIYDAIEALKKDNGST